MHHISCTYQRQSKYARCLIGKPSVSEVWQQSLVIPHNDECLPSLKCLATCFTFHTVYILYITRSYAALRAADLDWIVGQGYSSGGYILEKKH